MYRALVEIVQCARMDGELADDRGAPLHEPGCGCGTCLALVTLVRIEGGGRCAICGCTEGDECEDGCAWTSPARVCCDAHPLPTIALAEGLFAAASVEPAYRGD